MLIGTAINARILKACAYCDRLASKLWDLAAKVKIVWCLILLLGLYGCEVALPPDKSLARHSVSIAEA